jgi:hypothetical protein
MRQFGEVEELIVRRTPPVQPQAALAKVRVSAAVQSHVKEANCGGYLDIAVTVAAAARRWQTP